MLQNSNGANIYVVDGKSWTIGKRKISMWSGSKCNKPVDKVEDDKSDVDKVEDDKSDVDKSVI